MHTFNMLISRGCSPVDRNIIETSESGYKFEVDEKGGNERLMKGNEFIIRK